jgi:uncharacterized protein YoxC
LCSSTQSISVNIRQASSNISAMAENIQILDTDTDHTRQNANEVIQETNKLRNDGRELETTISDFLTEISKSKS